MLPIVLVLIAVSCAFGAPSANIYAYNINEVAPPSDDGRLVNSYLTNALYELVDGGARGSVYTLTAEQVTSDLVNQRDSYSQALGLAQAIALIGEVAPGLPGDACASSALVNAYASGNQGAIRQALGGYVNNINANIDAITNLANNPNALRYASSYRGNCPNGGRVYQFEGAWDRILAGANPYQIGLVNEQYCSAKRLYSAYSVESNNIGAAISASSTTPVANIFAQALGPVANFLRAAAVGGSNVAAAANAAKAAINRAAAAY